MTHRYVLTGPFGSGKTPIIAELEVMGFGVVAEPAREIIAEQRAIDGDGVYDRDRSLFVELMLQRAIEGFRRTEGDPRPVVFDRAIPDLVAYAEISDLDPSKAAEASRMHRYNDTVFLCPSWPEIYTTDEDRRATFEQAYAFGERVRAVYEELGYTILEVPRGTPAERARFIASVCG